MKVAEELLSYCSLCKMDLSAVVVAMRGDQVLRVMCKTCRKERSYSPPRGIKTPGAGAAATAGGRSAPKEKADHSVYAEWKKALMSSTQKPLLPYAANAEFQVGDRIQHPTFGEGVVLKATAANKAEIIFSMDIKTLICGSIRWTKT